MEKIERNFQREMRGEKLLKVENWATLAEFDLSCKYVDNVR